MSNGRICCICNACKYLVRVSEANELPISNMDRLDDIQTALKPLKNRKKTEIHFDNHFKTSWPIPNRPGSSQPSPTRLDQRDAF